MAYITGSLGALADPTRRVIFERLSKGPQSVGTLASGLPVSRPAVSQHLATLKAAGLVTDAAAGAKRIYRIDPHGLAAIRAWLDQFWTVSLDAFEAEVAKREEKDQ
jgi:DNA-binding transcriptional ArsR family regulator